MWWKFCFPQNHFLTAATGCFKAHRILFWIFPLEGWGLGELPPQLHGVFDTTISWEGCNLFRYVSKSTNAQCAVLHSMFTFQPDKLRHIFVVNTDFPVVFYEPLPHSAVGPPTQCYLFTHNPFGSSTHSFLASCLLIFNVLIYHMPFLMPY